MKKSVFLLIAMLLHVSIGFSQATKLTPSEALAKVSARYEGQSVDYFYTECTKADIVKAGSVMNVFFVF